MIDICYFSYYNILVARESRPESIATHYVATKIKSLLFGEIIMRFHFGKKDTCFYCGQYADTIDHSIPYSWFRDTERKGNRKQQAVGFMTGCCSECNTILGNKIFTTLQERCQYVKNRLSKKYKKYLSVEWNNDELKQLSGRLRQFVFSKNRLGNLVRARLNFQNTEEFVKMMEETKKEIYYTNEIPKEIKRFVIDEDYEP